MNLAFSLSSTCLSAAADRNCSDYRGASTCWASPFSLFKGLACQNPDMFGTERLQLAAPICVIGAVVGAQGCAHALATSPTSAFLWYLNLEVFQPIRYGIALPTAEQCLGGDGLAQSTWIAVPLLGLLCAGLLLSSRLPLAIASHLSLIYSAFLLYDSYDASVSPLTLATANVLWQPSYLLAVSLLLTSLLSSTASHREYWRELFLGGGARRSYFMPYNPSCISVGMRTHSGSRRQQLPSFATSG